MDVNTPICSTPLNIFSCTRRQVTWDLISSSYDPNYGFYMHLPNSILDRRMFTGVHLINAKHNLTNIKLHNFISKKILWSKYIDFIIMLENIIIVSIKQMEEGPMAQHPCMSKII